MARARQVIADEHASLRQSRCRISAGAATLRRRLLKAHEEGRRRVNVGRADAMKRMRCCPSAGFIPRSVTAAFPLSMLDDKAFADYSRRRYDRRDLKQIIPPATYQSLAHARRCRALLFGWPTAKMPEDDHALGNAVDSRKHNAR